MVDARDDGSPFFFCGPVAPPNKLAILHLKRDQLIPTLLHTEDTDKEGYDEGKVTNTRFGSFPHSTLIGLPWGSQVRASRVDTGSRGRRATNGDGQAKKRKREPDEQTPQEDDGVTNAKVKAPVEAASGFAHLLPPTPENWTTSLPHRTQVVYTPDYSYILHRIRARPGTRIIEAGAGSGSFTHAAARAVFSGSKSDNAAGKVWSFEFHDQRTQKLGQELRDHGLNDIVELSHADVCKDGFLTASKGSDGLRVNAVFLDLPAPWLALRHLHRLDNSPLDPTQPVHLCTFSPCIEQVQRTVTALRQLGWLEIDMVEIAAKRMDVRRDRIGIQEEGLHKADDSPATVEEAMIRLREVEGRSRAFLNRKQQSDERQEIVQSVTKQERLKKLKDAQQGRKLFKEGRLVTRMESELKAHTSYLVFAILPPRWTDEDEQAAETWAASLEHDNSMKKRISNG